MSRLVNPNLLSFFEYVGALIYDCNPIAAYVRRFLYMDPIKIIVVAANNDRVHPDII